MAEGDRGLRIGEDAYSRRQFVRAGGVAGAGVLLGSPLLAACGDGGSSSTGTQPSGPNGLSRVPTAPFQPSSKVGAKPDFPKRMAVLLPDTAEIWDAVDGGFKQALEARGVEHVSSSADGDPAKSIQQLNQALARGVSAIACFAIDPEAQRPALQRAIDMGVGVFTGVMAPATCQTATDQAGIGKLWGETAGRYIAEQLGGEAEIVIFNEDNVPSIKPRYTALRAALAATAPNARIVADEPYPGTQEKSFRLASTVLTSKPTANVWLAPDPGIMGALGALESANKVTDDTALFGVNGDPGTLDAIRRGGPIKATFGFGFPPLTYAMGQFAADWMEGKTIPQVVYATAFPIDSAAAIDNFAKGNSRPEQAFENDGGGFYRLAGNISYETRNRYLKVYA